MPFVFLAVAIMAIFAASVAARQLGGDTWEPAGEAVHDGGRGDDNGVVVHLLRQMYLQRLGAGPSGGTHSANAGCPH